MRFADVAAVLGWQALAAFLVIVVVVVVFVKTADADVTVIRAASRLPPAAFAGKVVFITGASSGIGEALAHELAPRGAKLILAARREDRLAAVADTLRRKFGSEVLTLRLDVEAFDTHAAAIQAAIAKFGHIDIFVNNAGRSQRALVEETSPTVDAEMMRLNVLAPMALTKAVLPHMLARKSGHIVFTSSVAGKVGSPLSATYSACKHAIQGFGAATYAELGSRGINVTLVCPGPVRSEITLHAFVDKPGAKLGVDEDNSTRMTAERCAHLMAAGMWARLPEVWLSPQPVLLFTYLGQYAPSLAAFLAPIVGAARVAAFRKGSTGYGSVQSPLKLLWSHLRGGPSKSD